MWRAETALPDKINPPTVSAAERIVAPMIELGTTTAASHTQWHSARQSWRQRDRTEQAGPHQPLGRNHSLGSVAVLPKQYAAHDHQRGGVHLRSGEGQLHLPQPNPQCQGRWCDTL
jgi:hypothetical protein